MLAAALPRTVADRRPDRADRLTVLAADALRLAGVPDPQPSALVANLPYNVAVPVVLHLLETLPSLRTGLVMVQAEVADRLAAAPGSRTYGVPSVKAAWYAASAAPGGARAVFWPVPNVDSVVASAAATRFRWRGVTMASCSPDRRGLASRRRRCGRPVVLGLSADPGRAGPPRRGVVRASRRVAVLPSSPASPPPRPSPILVESRLCGLEEPSDQAVGIAHYPSRVSRPTARVPEPVTFRVRRM